MIRKPKIPDSEIYNHGPLKSIRRNRKIHNSQIKLKLAAMGGGGGAWGGLRGLGPLGESGFLVSEAPHMRFKA